MSTKLISKDEVLHLAKLAGLTLTDEEIEKYTAQFGQTLDYVQNLNELNTDGVEPTNSVVNLSNVTFDDGVENDRQLKSDEAFSNGKNVKENAFVVERIM